MSDAGDGPSRSSSRRVVALVVVRCTFTASVLVALYFVAPLDPPDGTLSLLSRFVLAIAVFVVLMSWHVRRITRSETPAIQALEGLFVAVPFFLLLFASTFFLMSQADASSFSAPLTRIDALYMTITTFSTVGFGDLTPRTETARAVVSGQMVLNLIVLGLGVRIIATAVQRGRDRRVDEEGRPPSGG